MGHKQENPGYKTRYIFQHETICSSQGIPHLPNQLRPIKKLIKLTCQLIKKSVKAKLALVNSSKTTTSKLHRVTN